MKNNFKDRPRDIFFSFLLVFNVLLILIVRISNVLVLTFLNCAFAGVYILTKSLIDILLINTNTSNKRDHNIEMLKDLRDQIKKINTELK